MGDQWIPTTAHCLLLTQGQHMERISVYLGVHNYVATDEINRKMYLANNYVVHPNWNVNNFSNDIALIKLSTTVTVSQYIRPICLASLTEPDYTNEPATTCHRRRMGFTSDGLSASLSPLLRKVTVPVISNIASVVIPIPA
ncbi:serine protease SSP1-like [Daphnia pulicaria]|uniref:serine protease SSP1-like n=1 Tax=Daphnia pulicaria TaxID=35523 RepID=UPI001EEB6F29|nr:serine protease SSP1-like [Daphnia pulicaria]XP_046641500.1 serine protease SSP1-like [Daphnia pulicaria]